MFPSGPKRPCWLETRDLRKLCDVSTRAYLTSTISTLVKPHLPNSIMQPRTG